MAGAIAVQVARDDVFESCHRGDGSTTPSQDPTSFEQPTKLESRVEVRTPSAVEARVEVSATGNGADDRPVAGEVPMEDGSQSAGDGERASGITVARHSKLAPYKPGKMTVVLDMDECLLHSKFHGPGAASEAYRQSEQRPDAVTEVNSFWVALEDGDTAQVNKRPGLDPFLEALARDYNTIVFTAAMPDYAGPVLDYIDPKGTLFHRRLYRSSCRQVVTWTYGVNSKAIRKYVHHLAVGGKLGSLLFRPPQKIKVKGAFLKDLSVLGVEKTDLTRTVLVDNNPLSFICQPTNGVLVASFYDDPNDTALASVMQLIRHLDHAGDVRPILKDMFRLDTLLAEYRNALFDEDDEADDEATAVADVASGPDETGEVGAVEEENVLASDVADDAGSNPAEEREPREEDAEASNENGFVFEDRVGNVECAPAALKDDDDDESVETEPCSEESGESSLGEESLASGEEMELDLEF